jgi:5'-nucleotidase
MKTKKRIAIDMDNVMADIVTQFIAWYERATGYRMKPEDMVGIGESAAFPDPQLARSFLYQPGFFRDPPVMEDCVDVLKKLNEHYEVFIVSAAMEFPNSLGEKYEWLQEHFPFITWHQFVLCGSKSVIKADIMIDDHLKNLDFFDGEKLLFTSPHNANITGYTRVNNWKEVASMLLKEDVLVQSA